MSPWVAYWYLWEDKGYYKALWSEQQLESNYFLTSNRDQHGISLEISGLLAITGTSPASIPTLQKSKPILCLLLWS